MSVNLSKALETRVAGARTIILTDGALLAVAGRGDILKEFPFFRAPAANAVRTCCGRRADRNLLATHCRIVREALIRLPADRKQVLKRLLGAGKVVLFVRGARGVEQHEL